MKRFLALLICLTLVVFWGSNSPEKKTEVVRPVAIRAPLTLKPRPTQKFPSKPQVQVARLPASDKGGPDSSTPQDLPFEVNIEDQPLKIGRSFNLVKDLATIEAASFRPEMGQIMTQNQKYVFFRPSSSDVAAWPVAFNRSTKKLFPISHILHVKNIDSTLREQFRSEGYKEFYYHPSMKFISLETTPATVIKQFQELTARGFEATLEVLKDPHRPK